MRTHLPTWYLSRTGELCGSCGDRQAAASPMRRVRFGLGRCATCALRLFNETPPAILAPATAIRSAVLAPKNDAHPLQPFVERYRRVLDVKRRASGEDR